MENNTAFICRLSNIKPIEGADRIVSAGVNLHGAEITRVVVGADTKENTPIVYFDSNLCISQFAIEAIDKLSPDYGKEGFNSLGNYLGKNNRVRCIKLKGSYSNGLAVELDKFKKAFPSISEEEGFSFTEIDGKTICQKYVAPIKVQSQGNGNKKRKGKVESRMIEQQFNFHIDTQQLCRNLNKISPNNLIGVSRKIHGTSYIVGNNLVKRKLSFFEKILKNFIKIQETEYDLICASRSVVKNGTYGNSTGFYNFDIWTDIGEKYFKGKLHAGETVYGEAFGYLPTGQMIQKGYDYGQAPNTYGILIYRITNTTPDGVVREYSRSQIKNRCLELNVPFVQEYYYGIAKDMYPEIEVDENWAINFAERLKKDYLEKIATDCLSAKVPDEGVVVKIDEGVATDIFKLKSEMFYAHETKAAEKGEENLEDEA